jgi:arylsulfatase A-like enzyme
VLAALEESDLLDDTIVFYFSDHGETFHDRDGVTGKFVCTDDALRVPFIVMYRGRIPSGRRSSALIGLLDLMPTMLDYAGAVPQNSLHGQSLRLLLEGADDTPWRQSFYIENETHHALRRADQPVRPRRHERAVCTDRFKLIVAADDDAPRLYDMVDDPEERLDIVGGKLASAGGQIGEQVERLLRALLEHATAVDDDFGIEITRRHLVAMSG